MPNYALENLKWGSGSFGSSGGTVTWAVDSSMPAAFVSTMASAFAAWTAVANINFAQTASVGTAKIVLGMSAIDGPNNTLGVANYSYSGQSLIHSDITFDTGEGWSGGGTTAASASGAKLYYVAVHEIGHAIGLDHYNAAPAVMNSYLSPSLTGLTASDIAGIQAIYGASASYVQASTAAPAGTTTATPASTNGLNPVYRFFDTSNGHHFYTTDPAEKAGILATLPGMNYEGAAWATPVKGAGTTDVFRFFDTKSGSHFYTSDAYERDVTIATVKHYQYEGVAFQVYAQAGGEGTFTLDRFFNKVSGEHHYAASASETAGIKGGLAGPGWVDEGAGFTVHTAGAALLDV